VVAQTESGYVVLLAPDDLTACAGSIDLLTDAIEAAAMRVGLSWLA
jgi:hypothetical protein